MNDFTEKFAQNAFGTTTKSCQNQRTCIICRKPIHITNKPDNTEGNIYSQAGLNEYQITGMCEYCFDIAANMEDEEDDE